MDQYIKTLSYEEIVSLIEIVKQLQKSLKPDNENEGEEVRSKSDREIKQEKEYEGILSVPKEFLEKQESDIEVSKSICPTLVYCTPSARKEYTTHPFV